jgi:hypothetical protein
MTANPMTDIEEAASRERLNSTIAEAAEKFKQRGVTSRSDVRTAMYSGVILAEVIKPGASFGALTAALTELVMRELESDLPEV